MIRSITRTPDDPYFEIHARRAGLPFVIEATCPYCGAEAVRDLDENPLAYPFVGTLTEVLMWHQASTVPWLVHEWTENVKIGVTLEAFK